MTASQEISHSDLTSDEVRVLQLTWGVGGLGSLARNFNSGLVDKVTKDGKTVWRGVRVVVEEIPEELIRSLISKGLLMERNFRVKFTLLGYNVFSAWLEENDEKIKVTCSKCGEDYLAPNYRAVDGIKCIQCVREIFPWWGQDSDTSAWHQ